ncbi:centriolar satellite-associated tubulin polyglutamylase complex regulator 1-like [Diadema antillarum]|uniref:centriolar satellite-associated tubulin polyglutamylase complex regulator 1-like n=1 Tax=Diadema antillarum TaxID=105358 RepID=UPI003A89B7A5
MSDHSRQLRHSMLERFSLSPEEYLERHHVLTYLEDAVTQLLEFKEDQPKVDPAIFLQEYFTSILNGSHVLYREYDYIRSTPHNRASFVRLFWRCFSYIGKQGDLLTVREYHSLLNLLCPDFPLEPVHRTARIIFLEDAMDSLTSFADFLFAFQLQFYYEEFLQRCLDIYERQISAAQSPREAVYIPSETSPRQQQKKPPQAAADHPPPDSVDTRHFLDAIAKECQRAKYSYPAISNLSVPLDGCMRTSFYGFLVALSKSEAINGGIGMLPSKSSLYDDEASSSPAGERKGKRVPSLKPSTSAAS